MGAFTNALVPVLMLILAGQALNRTGFLPKETWPGIEKLTYYFLFPALLVRSLGRQSLEGVAWLPMLIVVAGTLAVAITALVLWHRLRASVSDYTFTSVFQGGVRFNTYIAFAVAESLYGPEGLALGAVAAGFMIVLINISCVTTLTHWGSTSEKGITIIFREIVKNPLLMGCVAGILLSVSGIGVSGMADSVLEIAGRAALPLGLLAVGAALRLDLVRGHLGPITVSSTVQFGLKPLAASLLVLALGLKGVVAGVLLIFFICPTATSGYILARQLGGDTETIASIITSQTLLAFLVMPLLSMVLPF